MPKVDHFGAPDAFSIDMLRRHANTSAAYSRMYIASVFENLHELFITRETRCDTKLDLSIIDCDEHAAWWAAKAVRIRRPRSVLVGMFCRLWD